MPPRGLHHINIAGPAALIESCRDFYVHVLGLEDGPRPPFRSRGFWLYAGDHAIVHLTERGELRDGASALDHFAFVCDGLEETIERLKSHSIAFTIDHVPATRQTQIFLRDPAGVGIELNFPDARD